VNAELSKVKLHAKSKIASLTSQLNQSRKASADAAEPVCYGNMQYFLYFALLIRSGIAHAQHCCKDAVILNSGYEL